MREQLTRWGDIRGRAVSAAIAAICSAGLALCAPAFAASGSWERAWGKDVVNGGGDGAEICTTAAACQIGSTATAAGGEFDLPWALATDSSGNVYVADAGNHRVQVFGPTGAFLRAWGTNVDSGGGGGFEVCTVAASCQAGSPGTGLGGELHTPFGIAVDAGGLVYVADAGHHRIQVFNSAGSFQRAWGKDVDVAAGTGFEVCTAAASCKAGSAASAAGGELNGPSAVAVAGGAAYVSDQLNNRVQAFTTAGSFQRAWGKDVDVAAGTGFEVCTAAASCKAGDGSGTDGGEMSSPRGIATDGTSVFVSESNRIHRFSTAGAFQLLVGDGSFNGAQGLALDSAGTLYVADTGGARIQEFGSGGAFQRAWGKDVDTGGGDGFEICTVEANCQPGTGGALGGELNSPVGVATSPSGAVYTSDYNHRVQRFLDPPVSADLRVTTTAIPSATVVAGTITYNVEVTNLGGANALGVELRDTFPSPIVQITNVAASQGTCGTSSPSPGPYFASCALGTLNAGGSAQMTVTARALGGGAQAGLASVTATSPADPNAADNQAQATATVAKPTSCTFTGTAGADMLAGGFGQDHICGLAGGDTVVGYAGNDVVDAGAGFDHIEYGFSGANDGDDRIVDDTQGYVYYYAATGQIQGNLATGTVTGAGTDTLVGVRSLVGGPFGDILTAAPSSSSLSGSLGNDLLIGGAGPDTLRGDENDDTIRSAGGGSDFIDGGPGFDRAQVDSTDSVVGVEVFF